MRRKSHFPPSTVNDAERERKSYQRSNFFFFLLFQLPWWDFLSIFFSSSCYTPTPTHDDDEWMRENWQFNPRHRRLRRSREKSSSRNTSKISIDYHQRRSFAAAAQLAYNLIAFNRQRAERKKKFCISYTTMLHDTKKSSNCVVQFQFVHSNSTLGERLGNIFRRLWSQFNISHCLRLSLFPSNSHCERPFCLHIEAIRSVLCARLASIQPSNIVGVFTALFVSQFSLSILFFLLDDSFDIIFLVLFGISRLSSFSVFDRPRHPPTSSSSSPIRP